MMYPAHDDGYFGTRVNAKATVNTAHHIDIEAGRKFLDLGVRVLTRFDVDALGGADGRAHITGNTFQAAIVAHGQNMCAAESLRIGPRLFGIVDGWTVALEETGEQPPKCDAKSSKGRPYAGVFPAGSFADVDDWNVDGITILDRRHRSTSS